MRVEWEGKERACRRNCINPISGSWVRQVSDCVSDYYWSSSGRGTTSTKTEGPSDPKTGKAKIDSWIWSEWVSEWVSEWWQ